MEQMKRKQRTAQDDWKKKNRLCVCARAHV